MVKRVVQIKDVKKNPKTILQKLIKTLLQKGVLTIAEVKEIKGE